MELFRLLYTSENAIDVSKASMISQINNILASANHKNKQRAVTGALIFDKYQFAQVLEGSNDDVEELFKHIEKDPRHCNVVMLELKPVPHRVFGNWWMGCCEISGRNAEIHTHFLQDGKFLLNCMTNDEIISLMVQLSGIGYQRQLAS